MFKKLFGKKQRVKPESLAEAKTLLTENIKEESLNKNIGESFSDCLELFDKASQDEKDDFAASILTLVNELPTQQSAIALSICANLFERGYTNLPLIDELVNLYIKHLQSSKSFFTLLDQMVKEGEEGESDIDIDVDSLYGELLNNKNIVSESVGESVGRVQAFSQQIIAILSIDSSLITQYKSKLKDEISVVKSYSQAVYWLERLLDLLHNEPVLIIDVDNHIGFEGKMSGVSDNYQMQHLLMGMPEINKVPAIDELQLSVANGTGIHVSNFTIPAKWNMYNYEMTKEEGWEEIKIGPAKTHELQDFWIWGEGTPHEISVHNGRRVILLGRSSTNRTTRLQRAFKNVKAGIEVEKMLTDEEIDTWLGFH